MHGATCQARSHKIKGKIVEAIKWTDASGENILAISEFRDGKILEPRYASEIVCSQFTKKGGRYEQVWRVKDFNYMDSIVEYLRDTLAIFDLDDDGIAESSFFYSILNPDTQVMKYMMHSKGRRLAIKARWSIAPDTKPRLLQFSTEDTFSEFPPQFKAHALKKWDARFKGAR